jgi:hypothetical protein
MPCAFNDLPASKPYQLAGSARQRQALFARWDPTPLQGALRVDSTATRFDFDHPGQYRGSFHKNALLVRKGAESVARHLSWLVAVVCQVTGPQGCLVNDIAISIGPLLKEIDRVVEVCDFEDQILPFTQVNWSIKHLRVHLYPTEFVGFQQGRRYFLAPFADLFLRLGEFKWLDVHFLCCLR